MKMITLPYRIYNRIIIFTFFLTFISSIHTLINKRPKNDLKRFKSNEGAIPKSIDGLAMGHVWIGFVSGEKCLHSYATRLLNG